MTASDTEKKALKSALYDKHIALADPHKIVPFAGYLMPLWYTTISEEHEAVRKKCGMFDCTHMGVLSFKGRSALDFLNDICPNDVTKLADGQAQYSFFLNDAGDVLDDIIIYRRAPDNFMVVVNAANEAKIKAHLKHLVSGKGVIDSQDTTRVLSGLPKIADLRDPEISGDDARVDLALQGPTAIDVIDALLANDEDKAKLATLKPFWFFETTFQEMDVIVSRTGYTGANIGFELFVHPELVGKLFNGILLSGAVFGATPCGLGARDSLRIEGGLPLYGQELGGERNISPFEAGYGWAVKCHKAFFIGQRGMIHHKENQTMQLIRIAIAGMKGVRPVRENDVVLFDGKCVGWVLSCAKSGTTQMALCYVLFDLIAPDDVVGIYYVARNDRHIAQGKVAQGTLQQTLVSDIDATVLKRFEKF